MSPNCHLNSHELFEVPPPNPDTDTHMGGLQKVHGECILLKNCAWISNLFALEEIDLTCISMNFEVTAHVYTQTQTHTWHFWFQCFQLMFTLSGLPNQFYFSVYLNLVSESGFLHADI